MESPGRSTWNGHQDSRWHLLCVCSRQPVGRCCTRESLELYCNNNMRRLPPSTLHMFLSVSSTTAVVVVDCTFAFSYVNFLGRGGGSKTTFSNFRNVACRQHEPTLHPILFSFFFIPSFTALWDEQFHAVFRAPNGHVRPDKQKKSPWRPIKSS